MYAAAIDWARTHLDHDVTEVVPLQGGRTSAMLALHGRSGRSSVLRLITEEPWRTHGQSLAARESDTRVTLASTAIPAPRSIALDAGGLPPATRPI
ncbi:hypothetical protein [Nocardioides sp. B-3]|uniref:hypothetical protein n=1 Tax=Nocardioides sp. B-3 TaxID=2895565 RepID=UPI0021529D44|nr:hypothetical protein [Nocardioides sp. B-3]UUZ57828.1 hypothetical protein LP418_15655 [Nocardioides sp. B-3]